MEGVKTELYRQLDELLAEGVEGARTREASTFDQLTAGGPSKFVLFGAGNLGRYTLTRLRKLGIEPLCFIDNNESRWGEDLDGVRILSPEEGANLYKEQAVFIVTIWFGEAKDRMSSRVSQMRGLGCQYVIPFIPLYWKYPDAFLPRYMVDLPHLVHLQADRVREGYRLMADDASRREYLAQLRFRLLGDLDCLPAPVSGDVYFREELFSLGEDETLVDCGAFDGDTLNSFLRKTGNSFKRAIAFEPDFINFEKLAERVNRFPSDVGQRITLHQLATGETNERVLMDVGSGVASQIGIGDHEVESVALDSFLPEVPVSFLKMDIEGSEVATLSGARRLIQQNSPLLAVCVYHRQDHLWKVPLLIQSLNPDYSFYLRPHLQEGWDLICYAVPGGRRY